MHPKNIKIEDFTYNLPDERIAKFPLSDRSSSKFLTFKQGKISHTVFKNICSELPENSLLVFNNTRVIQARMIFHKETGARIEIFLLEPIFPADYAVSFAETKTVEWLCMIGNANKWKSGELTCQFQINEQTVTLRAERLSSEGRAQKVRFTWNGNAVSFAEVIDKVGELPIPPYLNRDTQESDKTTYQTVYSKIKGSVAAPTAGLHFTPELLSELDEKGFERAEITLHVGAGTFQPVKSETMDGHEMHTEFVSIRREVIKHLKSKLGSVIAVGTTSVRTLESLYFMGVEIIKNPNIDMADLHVNQWTPYDNDFSEYSSEAALQAIIDYLDRKGMDRLVSSTQIIIAPSYQFHIIRGMITNFHQPTSTLLLLVSALIGDSWREVYDYAMKNDFRFLSYGDSSMLLP